ncbi:hypothetical protein C8Q75DRAFT_722360 [Abortiporus biennis]|nr:hypothetical protein C8Q75DRAFT_722360 [Abortiporus biennis]
MERRLACLRLIPYPNSRNHRRIRLHFNFITVPLFSVLLLLAVGAIDGIIVRKGILGADGIQPINILALFISLAYISISLDFTGLLRFAAFWVARKGGSSGHRLYLYLYVFFLVCGVLVGNDPVILSGTAFLAYFTRVTGITPPTAWIFSQFAAANMASVVLVSSNPTNLVLSGAFSISFISYTAHVIIPFLAAAFFVLPVLFLGLFRSSRLIPHSLNLNLGEGDNTNAGLVDKQGAIFGSVLLLITLGVLVGTSTVGVPVWEVTVPSAVLMLLRDIVHDWSRHNDIRKHVGSSLVPLQEIPVDKKADTRIEVRTGEELPQTSDSPNPMEHQEHPSFHHKTSPPFDLTTFFASQFHRIATIFPTATTILRRLPIALLPFAFLMFILVQGLSSQGWVELFSKGWSAWVDRTGVLGAIGGMGFISCIFCNICGTNIGATILLARMIQMWISQHTDNEGSATIDPRSRDGAIYALAIGSNFGAFTLTFSASLAGLLWKEILRQKGIHVRARQFLFLNLPIAFVAMIVASTTLVAEVYIIHRN